MGKREVGQLGIIDLIVSILIAELTALSIQTEKSIFVSIVPIIVLVIVQILISYITLKNEKIRTIINVDMKKDMFTFIISVHNVYFFIYSIF